MRKSNDYHKAIKHADKLIAKAKRERDARGYRENLGYDSQRNLEAFMSKNHDMTYGEKCHIITYFNRQCDAI